jgi:ATP-binding cassette subfamily B (MDR/TAP) protein 1
MAAVTDHDIARDGLEPKFPHLEPRLSITETRPCSTHAQKYMTLPQPASEEADTTRPSSGFIARLRPRSPYFSLFRCLDTATDKIILALGVILAIAAGAPLPIIGLLFSQIIDSFPPPEDELNAKLYELIGVACVYFVLSWGWCVCWGLVGQRIARNRRETLVSSVLGLDMATYDVSAPDVATSLTTDCQTILLGTSEKVGLFIQSISYFVSTICVGFALNAKLTSILLAAVVPSMSVIVFCGASITSKWSKRASMLAENAAKIAEEAIGATKLIQAYDVAAIFIKSHDELMTRHVSAGLRKSIASASMLGSVYFVCYSTNALAFFAGNKLQPEGGAGKIYAITFLLLDATFVIGQVGPFIQTLTLAGAAAKRINNLVESSSAIDVYSGAGIVVTKEHFQGDIMVKDLSFRYPARPDVDVLNNVSMDFGPGSFTALLGLSGSGKSTIASLLLRLYDSDHGCIKLAGVDLKHYNVSSLRSHIAVVDQNSVLFRGSILQNIAQGIPKVANLTDDGVLRECERAASEASCDFIPDLVNGIHTTIGGEDGVELSGGQRQRISLARALARRPALLILDEPTASLDSTSEAFVIDALKRVIKSGMTVIMVTHRLASISHADNIVVMESGIIVEQGDHDHLAQQDGLYAKLLSTQQSRHGSNIPGDDRPTSSDSEKTLVAMTPKVAAEVKASKADVGNALAANDSGTLSRSTTSVVRRIWTLSRPERPLILLGTIASLLTGALIIGEAFIFGHLVAALNAEIPDRAIIHLYCLMFFVLGLIALIAYTTSGSSFGYVSERLAGRVQHLSLECTLDQDQAFFNSPKCRNIHELAASISGDCAALTGLSGVIIGTICSVLVSMFGGLILALIVAWKIAVVLLAVVPIMFLACWLRLHTAAAFEKRHKSAYGGGAAIAMEACKGIRTVAAYGLEHDVLKRYEDTVKKPYEEGTKMILLGNIILAMSYSITYFVYALAYWWYVMFYLNRSGSCMLTPMNIGVRLKYVTAAIANYSSSLFCRHCCFQLRHPGNSSLCHQKSRARKSLRTVSSISLTLNPAF